MKYDSLPVIMEGYSFISKMNICQIYSCKIIDLNGIKIEKILNSVAPWDLETFLLFSLKADEHLDKDFREKNDRDFINIINCIKDYQHPLLSAREDNISFADLVIMALGLIQFDLQEYNIYKYYRYYWFFNFKNEEIDLIKIFKDYFDCSYEQFMSIGFLLNILYSGDKIIPNEVIEFIIKKYEKAFTKLMANREFLVNQIDKFASNIEDYLYCVRPFYMYPFIAEKSHVYLPLPHCLTRATTASLLYRLTDNDNDLRQKIGKNVIESYLYEIISESDLFEEIKEEQEYIIHKYKKRTLDVMCRKDSKYLFLDSKSMTPYSKLRQFDLNFINKEIEKFAKYVIQTYKHLTQKFNIEYNFFDKKENRISKENIWGLVVILEDSHIRRELIYEKVCELLPIEKNSADYQWLINHIKVVSLYDIERSVFVKEDIIYKLEKQFLNNRPFDYSLIGSLESNVLKNAKVNEFKKILKEDLLKISNELVEAKIIM